MEMCEITGGFSYQKCRPWWSMMNPHPYFEGFFTSHFNWWWTHQIHLLNLLVMVCYCCTRWWSNIQMITIQHVTLWLFNIAMENRPFIDGLPIKNWWFSMAMLVITRGYLTRGYYASYWWWWILLHQCEDRNLKRSLASLARHLAEKTIPWFQCGPTCATSWLAPTWVAL